MDTKEKINGTNLGNWLVLEKWMFPELFEPCGAEDEIWLHRSLEEKELRALLKRHRDTYITEADFANIAAHGMNLVRLPVPYFVFDDCPGHPGCIEYVDLAMDWAEKYGLQVLLDLHTVPDSQNGYDNGGITGVCKWRKDPEKVQFALSVLDRLSARYGSRPGLYGIEVLNEPISLLVYVTAPSTGKARDAEEAKGSGYVPMKFLKSFYREAYRTVRAHLPAEKAVVFHDGFRLTAWGRFFRREGMEHVVLDTHIYITAMELFFPVHALWLYRLFVRFYLFQIRRAAKHTPVVVGEWNTENGRALRLASREQNPERREAVRSEVYHQISALERRAWNDSAGCIYWNYKLHRDLDDAPLRGTRGESLDAWDLRRVWEKNWMTEVEPG